MRRSLRKWRRKEGLCAMVSGRTGGRKIIEEHSDPYTELKYALSSVSQYALMRAADVRREIFVWVAQLLVFCRKDCIQQIHNALRRTSIATFSGRTIILGTTTKRAAKCCRLRQPWHLGESNHVRWFNRRSSHASQLRDRQGLRSQAITFFGRLLAGILFTLPPSS